MCNHNPQPDTRYGHLTCTNCGKVFAIGLQIFETYYIHAGRRYDFK